MTSSPNLFLRTFLSLATAMLCACQAWAGESLHCTGQSAVDVGGLKGQAIVIGERHGTREIPAFAGALACDLLRSGRPVILALELDGDQQEAVNRYVEATESDAGRARDALLAGPAWRESCQDGRTSQAVVDLLEQARQWRSAGARIGVLALRRNESLRVPTTPADLVPLDPLGNELQRHGYDRVMAENLVYAAVLYRQFTVVALVGAGHASTVHGRDEDPDFDPMGRLVAQAVATSFIGIRTEGGTSWGAGGSRCGASPVDASRFFDGASRIDVVVPIARVTASPPAVRLP